MKTRLDQLLVEKELVPTREKAKSLILAGQVIVNDQCVSKPGQLVSGESTIRIRQSEHPYVSRGAIKLKAALEQFHVSAEGKVALDVGASTGGFTEVLLQSGAKKVFAVDVGTNQLDWKLRSDMRVVSMEKVNARYLTPETIGEKVQLIVMDVSFISVEKIIPALLPLATPETDWIVLIKPQFELSPKEVSKGGIVRKESLRQKAVNKVTEYGERHGLEKRGLIQSPIAGATGNIEYLIHWKFA